jgi:hypothetical protein
MVVWLPHAPAWFIASFVLFYAVVWAVVFHRLSRIGRGLAAFAWAFLILATIIFLLNGFVPT